MATDVRLLAQGTVIFEDISIEQFEGTVIKVIPKVPTKNQVRNLRNACILRINPSLVFTESWIICILPHNLLE